MRWRRGELRGPDLPEPPEEEAPDVAAVGAWLPARRAPVVIDGERPWAPERGRPSWAALVIVSILAALLGGGVVAAFSRPAAPATARAAPTAGATTQEPPASATPAMVAPTTSPLATPSRSGSSAAAPAASTAAPATPTSKATAPGRIAAATPTLDPNATPLELAGKAASGLPGTPLAPGGAVTSVVDAATKPRDLYALRLRAGTQLTVSFQAVSSDAFVTLGPAGALPELERGDLGVCTNDANCARAVPIAADGDYLLLVEAYGSGVRYTLRTATAPLTPPPGAAERTGTVAGELPGTPLALGATVASVVDENAKRRDVYALQLRAGQTLHVAVDAPGGDDLVELVPPGGSLGDFGGPTLCASLDACRQAAPIAATGTYALVVEATGPAVRYTLHAAAA